MNELYNKTIEYNGKTYHYDPDQDIFYRRYNEDMSHWDRWSPVYTLVVLIIIAVFLENR